MKQFVFRTAPLLFASALAFIGCAEILGLEPPNEGPSTTGGSGGATTGGNSTGGNSTGGNSTGGTSTGGHGGDTGGCNKDSDCPQNYATPCLVPHCNANICEASPVAEGTQVSCYEGAADTIGVGPCQVGVLHCDASGNPTEGCKGQITPRPEDCSTTVRESCTNQPDGCPSNVQITVIQGVGANDVRAIQAGPNGDIYVAGNFYDSMNIGAGTPCSLKASGGGKAAFIAKLASDMSCVWSARFEDDDVIEGVSLNGLALAGAKVWAIGSAVGAFVVHDGNDANAKTGIGGGKRVGVLLGWDTADGLNVDMIMAQGTGTGVGTGGIAASGNIVFGSFSFSGSTTFTRTGAEITPPLVGAYDIAVVRYDSFNSVLDWVKTFGSASEDEAGALAVQSSDLIVGGMFGWNKGQMSTHPIELAHAAPGEDAVVFKIGLTDGAVTAAEGFGRVDGAAVIATSGIWPRGQDAVTIVGRSLGPTTSAGCLSGGSTGFNGWLRTSNVSLTDCSGSVLEAGNNDASFVRVTGIGTTPIVAGHYNGGLLGRVSAGQDGILVSYPGSASPASGYYPFSSPGKDVVGDMTIHLPDNVIYVVGACQDGPLNDVGDCDSSGDGFIAKITP